MINENGGPPVPTVNPPSNSIGVSNLAPSTIISKTETRRDLFRNVFGRCLTLAVLMADCAGNERAVDHLLRAKDQLHRRCR